MACHCVTLEARWRALQVPRPSSVARPRESECSTRLRDERVLDERAFGARSGVRNSLVLQAVSAWGRLRAWFVYTRVVRRSVNGVTMASHEMASYEQALR